MMILKLLGGGIVICASVMIGNFYTSKLKKRIEFLREFNHDIILLKSRISEREKLSRAFWYVSNFSKYSMLWRGFCKDLEVVGVGRALECGVKQIKQEVYLTSDDVEVILMLANGLGNTDISAQREHIDYVAGMISIAASNAQEEYEKNCKLYRSGSVLIGVLTVILLL